MPGTDTPDPEKKPDPKPPEGGTEPKPKDPAPSGGTEPKPEDKADEEAWIKKRLDQKQRSTEANLFKELGVANAEEATTKLAELKKLQDEKLSDDERKQKQIDEGNEYKVLSESLLKTVDAHVKVRLEAMTEAQQVQVKAMADRMSGKPAQNLLDAIDIMSPGFTVAAPDGQKPDGVNPDGTPKEKPKDTAPKANAPPDDGGTKTSPTDYKARYKELKNSNPVQAAHYLNNHQNEIFPR